MEKKTKTMTLILVAIVVILIIAAIFLLLSIKHPLNVTITDLYSTEAECGDGKTLFMNITFENNGEETAWISNPVIITDQGRELYCDFIKADEGIDFTSGGLQVTQNEIVNVTIKTWDTNNSRHCLPSGETPKYFQYNFGSGIVSAPSVHKVQISDDLIKNV